MLSEMHFFTSIVGNRLFSLIRYMIDPTIHKKMIVFKSLIFANSRKSEKCFQFLKRKKAKFIGKTKIRRDKKKKFDK